MPPHFIHETKTIAYDVINVNLFSRTVNKISPQKDGNRGPYYTTTKVSLNFLGMFIEIFIKTQLPTFIS